MLMESELVLILVAARIHWSLWLLADVLVDSPLEHAPSHRF
jgi:hypothetical protein